MCPCTSLNNFNISEMCCFSRKSNWSGVFQGQPWILRGILGKGTPKLILEMFNCFIHLFSLIKNLSLQEPGFTIQLHFPVKIQILKQTSFQGKFSIINCPHSLHQKCVKSQTPTPEKLLHFRSAFLWNLIFNTSSKTGFVFSLSENSSV